MNRSGAAIILILVCALSHQALGDEIEVKSLNRSSTGFFVFSPDFVRIKPGDTINFVATDKGHQVYSVPGMIREGPRHLARTAQEKLSAGQGASCGQRMLCFLQPHSVEPSHAYPGHRR